MGWLVSAGFFPALLAASEQATPLQYGVAAVAGLLVFYAIRLIIAKTGDLKANVTVKARMSSDSSPFDPMEQVFRDKRLFLKDLAPLGRNMVLGKHFIDCEIIGPGNAVLSLRSSENVPWPDIRQNTFYDVNMIQIAPPNPDGRSPQYHNSVQFVDCHFIRCHFYTLNLLFFLRVPQEWNWITPDFDQPSLLEDRSDGQKA